MKTFHQIVVIALAGLLAVACADFGCDYGDSSWYGEYETGFLPYSGNTVTTSISLTFSEDGQECCAVYETKGMDGMLYLIDYIGPQHNYYHVQWSSRNTFTLSISVVNNPDLYYGQEQTIVVYEGKITGRKMKLDLLSCDRVQQTIELKKSD